MLKTLRRLSGVCINACGRIPVDASRSASQLRTRRWDCGSAVVHSYLSARVSIFCRCVVHPPCKTLTLICCRRFQDHATVIHLFLALMYAKDHEVGWDPTICYARDRNGEVLLHDGVPRLDITIHKDGEEPEVYRTTRIISDIAADSPLGKGTRVWEAMKLNANNEEVGHPVALKDSWIDHDRMREGDIQAQIRSEMATAKDKEDMDRLFLTVLAHGDVYIQERPDHTRDLITHGADVPIDCPDFILPNQLKIRKSQTSKSRGRSRPAPPTMGTGHHRSLEEQMPPPATQIRYLLKIHYRIVFREVCEPLHKMTSMRDVFNVLRQIVLGETIRVCCIV